MKSASLNKFAIIIFILASFLIFVDKTNAQQITGLSGWNIFLDPGHSKNENMGIYNYSEAKKNLRVGLNLREMLLEWTDIDTVYMCRTNDQQVVSLTQRTDLANSLGAAHYHSIHSDAATNGSPANSTLIMWGQLGIGGPEKTPNGGKKMSQIMVGLLTAGMRTTTRGAMGDRDFYQVAGSTPYLHVNRETNMASELSEAGFHTNPIQNQLNMNESWKRLEAKTMFWTILKYHNISRPFAGTSVGIVKDFESGLAVNGAIVSLNGQIDTTDTWESLFHNYSSDPNLLRNGFYYFEDIPAGTHQIQVQAEGFDLYSANITMFDTFFTFHDVSLISNTPPTIASTDPAQNDSLYPGVENIIIDFTRQMNKTSVESNITISPNVTYTTAWSNSDKTLSITTTNLSFNSNYQLTIGGNSLGKYGHPFDGDGNGIGGDSFTLNFKTKVADTNAPFVVDVYPATSTTNIEVKPVINVAFNELLKTSTISSRFKIVRNSTQTNAAGILRHYIVNGKSVLNFFITTLLAENESYTIKVQAGIEDIFGNPTPVDYEYVFTTGNSNYLSQSVIDNFEVGVGNWWEPETSGSTVGINPLTTNKTSSTAALNHNTGSTKSMQLDYEWVTTASDWLIREYFSLNTPTFQNNTIVQVFMFGDGSNNKFRFALEETSTSSFEVSPWYDINWSGWKLINWDLSLGQTGNWIGNNILEPPFTFDSFQLTYSPGNSNISTLYFDDVRTASFSPVGIEEIRGIIPTEFILEQNFPNPFNPNTKIRWQSPVSGNQTIKVYDVLGNEVATLVSEFRSAGTYVINFDGSNLSSGVYFYTLQVADFIQTNKMILIK